MSLVSNQNSSSVSGESQSQQLVMLSSNLANLCLAISLKDDSYAKIQMPNMKLYSPIFGFLRNRNLLKADKLNAPYCKAKCSILHFGINLKTTKILVSKHSHG